MATKSKVRYRKRVWLNKDKTKRAFVIADSESTRIWNGRTAAYPEMSARLQIGDCIRNIELDFSISSPEEKRNVLFKAQMFREVINNFLDAVEVEAAKSDFKPIKINNGKSKGNSKKTVGTVR